jgi:hypothetical protein
MTSPARDRIVCVSAITRTAASLTLAIMKSGSMRSGNAAARWNYVF